MGALVLTALVFGGNFVALELGLAHTGPMTLQAWAVLSATVVRHVSDRVAVMYLGRIVELGECDDLYGSSGHPYAQALLSAVPVPDPVVERSRRRILLQGDPPSPLDPPGGCHFNPRCGRSEQRCSDEVPALEPRPGTPPASLVACHFAGPGRATDPLAAVR